MRAWVPSRAKTRTCPGCIRPIGLRTGPWGRRIAALRIGRPQRSSPSPIVQPAFARLACGGSASQNTTCASLVLAQGGPHSVLPIHRILACFVLRTALADFACSRCAWRRWPTAGIVRSVQAEDEECVTRVTSDSVQPCSVWACGARPGLHL
eukprot:2388102-Pyramimonas_sp.AAC.3